MDLPVYHAKNYAAHYSAPQNLILLVQRVNVLARMVTTCPKLHPNVRNATTKI